MDESDRGDGDRNDGGRNDGGRNEGDRNDGGGGEQTERGGRAGDITETDVTGPTLTWLELDEPKRTIPIGENDRVLDSRYNEEYDAWEILLVALPDDED